MIEQGDSERLSEPDDSSASPAAATLAPFSVVRLVAVLAGWFVLISVLATGPTVLYRVMESAISYGSFLGPANMLVIVSVFAITSVAHSISMVAVGLAMFVVPRASLWFVAAVINNVYIIALFVGLPLLLNNGSRFTASEGMTQIFIYQTSAIMIFCMVRLLLSRQYISTRSQSYRSRTVPFSFLITVAITVAILLAASTLVSAGTDPRFGWNEFGRLLIFAPHAVTSMLLPTLPMLSRRSWPWILGLSLSHLITVAIQVAGMIWIVYAGNNVVSWYNVLAQPVLGIIALLLFGLSLRLVRVRFWLPPRPGGAL